MKLAGFNFKKISGERISNSLKEIKVNTEINIANISQPKVSLFKSKEDFLEIDFNYSLTYEPDFAKIEISGTLVVSIEPKKAKEIVKEWKSKKLPEDFKIYVFNIILRKSNIKSLQLEEELHLPIHLNLQRIAPQKKEE